MGQHVERAGQVQQAQRGVNTLYRARFVVVEHPVRTGESHVVVRHLRRAGWFVVQPSTGAERCYTCLGEPLQSQVRIRGTHSAECAGIQGRFPSNS